MIAYFAQPNRFHPHLLKIIKSNYKNFKAVFSHFIINNKEYACHLSNHQIEHVTIDRILQVKSADFFSGVLHPKYVDLLNPSFSFTVISNPVNRIYQLFYIFKFLEKEYKKEGIVQKVFKNKKDLTMEYYIDGVIENNFYKDVIIDHIFLLPFETEYKLDFVGIAEDSETTKKVLQEKLKINLNNFDFTERIDRCSYRINDLQNVLTGEIDRYNRLRTRLKLL